MSGRMPAPLRMAAWVVLLFLSLAGAVCAAQLAGGSFDNNAAVCAGGGPSVSASYRQPVCTVGQATPCGLSAGATIVNHAGVVQWLPVAHSAAAAWNEYR